MTEEIEMDNLDPDTKVDDNNDDNVIETSISHFNEDVLSRIIQRRHADEGYDTVIEKLLDKPPTHLKAEKRNIYFADASVEVLSENYLLENYRDAGNPRYKPVEIGVIKQVRQKVELA